MMASLASVQPLSGCVWHWGTALAGSGTRSTPVCYPSACNLHIRLFDRCSLCDNLVESSPKSGRVPHADQNPSITALTFPSGSRPQAASSDRFPRHVKPVYSSDGPGIGEAFGQRRRHELRLSVEREALTYG